MGLKIKTVVITGIFALLFFSGGGDVAAQQPTIVVTDAVSTQVESLTRPDALIPLTPPERGWIRITAAQSINRRAVGPRPADFTIQPRFKIVAAQGVSRVDLSPRPDLPREDPPVIRIKVTAAAGLQRVPLVDPCGVPLHDCPSRRGEPSFSLHQDSSDGATGFKIDITQITDPVTGSASSFKIGAFQTKVTYDGSCVNILDGREMDVPITDRNIDNTAGVATFDGSDASGVARPADLAHALTRLNGSANQQCRVDLELNSVADSDGNQITVPQVLTQMVQRGDARADGNVTIEDAWYIAEYLVGSREACTTVVDTTCLHSVNAASVQQDGSFDLITIADALAIAQYLTGLRDEFYNLIP
jgi:hypothetical protein